MILRDLSYFESFLSLEFCGETGLRTFSPQVPYLQGYNNAYITLSNVLVTDVCLIQSHIVFMVSVHLNITIQGNITHSIIKITRSNFTNSFFDIIFVKTPFIITEWIS